MSQAHDDPAVVSASQQDDDERLARAKKPDDDEGHGDGSKPVSDEPVSDKPVSDKPVSGKPVSDEPVSDKPVSDKPVSQLQIMYDKVATQHDKIDDFRAKLLALLPIATGIGLFALVKDAPNDIGFFLPIGIFGAIASFGLFVHELRGITECYMLIELGAALENKLTPKMKLRGAFSGRSSWGFAWYVIPSWYVIPRMKIVPHNKTNVSRTNVSRETAALIVYPTVIAAWVFLAGWPLGLVWSLALSLLVLAVTVGWGLKSLKQGAEDVLKYIKEKKEEEEEVKEEEG
jgi:hypothetical protein